MNGIHEDQDSSIPREGRNERRVDPLLMMAVALGVMLLVMMAIMIGGG